MMSTHAPRFAPDWLTAFAVETRRTATAHSKVPNSCILTTRLGQMVLDRLGVKAQPRAVNVSVFNPAGGPVCIGLDSTWTPHDPAHATVDRGGRNETLILYRPIPPQDQVGRQWRTAPDWTKDMPHLEEEADRIASQVGAPEVTHG